MGAFAERLGQDLDAFRHHCIGLTGMHLVGARPVFEALEHVGAQDAPDRADGQRHVDVQPAPGLGALIGLLLIDQEHAERFEPDIAQRKLVALVILAEAAGPAGTGGDIGVSVRHCPGADPFGLGAQEVGQVASGEAGRAALADIGQFAPGHQVFAGRGRKRARAVSHVLEDGLEHALGPPMQPAEQDLGPLDLLFAHRWGNIGTIMMVRGDGHWQPFLTACPRSQSYLRKASSDNVFQMAPG